GVDTLWISRGCATIESVGEGPLTCGFSPPPQPWEARASGLPPPPHPWGGARRSRAEGPPTRLLFLQPLELGQQLVHRHVAVLLPEGFLGRRPDPSRRSRAALGQRVQREPP